MLSESSLTCDLWPVFASQCSGIEILNISTFYPTTEHTWAPVMFFLLSYSWSAKITWFTDQTLWDSIPELVAHRRRIEVLVGKWSVTVSGTKNEKHNKNKRYEYKKIIVAWKRKSKPKGILKRENRTTTQEDQNNPRRIPGTWYVLLEGSNV